MYTICPNRFGILVFGNSYMEQNHINTPRVSTIKLRIKNNNPNIKTGWDGIKDLGGQPVNFRRASKPVQKQADQLK